MSELFQVEERGLACGMRCFGPPPASLAGWYPVAMTESADGWWWRYLGDKRFVEPFFHDTIRSSGKGETSVCRTSLEALAEVPNKTRPSALIFHLSRCGSTLLTQMLATLPHCIVHSEPSAVESLLRHRQAGQIASAEQVLRDLIGVLGQRRFPAEAQCVVKLDCWHIHDLPLFRQAFPGVPFLFVYREPAEVISSHCRQRGIQMVPGAIAPARLGLEAASWAPGNLDAYCALVLEKILEAAFCHAEELILINYRELPELLWSGLLERLSIPCAPEDLDLIKERTRRHSKQPEREFDGDSASVGAPDVAAARSWYGELERLRR